MHEKFTVQDMMTKDVVSVYPDTPLIEAARIIAEHNFDGVPVVARDNTLAGLLTEYDILSKSTRTHLSVFQHIFQNVDALAQDSSGIQKELQELSVMTVADAMNKEPLTLSFDATFEEVVSTFRDHHRVNPVPVVDEGKKLVGVVSRFDILKPLHQFSL